MSWARKNEFVPGAITLSVCLIEGDAEFAAVVNEIASTDFHRLVISVGTFKNLEIVQPSTRMWRQLMLQGSVHTSFMGLERFAGLVELECDTKCEKPYPDFSKLVKLEKCFLSWNKNYDAKPHGHGLFILPKLRDLTLRQWTKLDCTEFAQVKNLERLDLRQGVLSSTTGLEKCQHLRVLELNHLPKLTDISSLDKLKGLENLHIENCPNIVDYEPLTHLKNVRHIHLEKVDARFPDVNWLAGMKNLEKINLGGEFQTIDWKVLFNHPTLRDVGITSHEGYSVADADILKIAKTAKRKVLNFKRLGTKKKPSFVFDLE